MTEEHLATCIGCRKATPCLEAFCNEPELHDYWCPDCLSDKIYDRPDPTDLAFERMND